MADRFLDGTQNCAAAIVVFGISGIEMWMHPNQNMRVLSQIVSLIDLFVASWFVFLLATRFHIGNMPTEESYSLRKGKTH